MDSFAGGIPFELHEKHDIEVKLAESVRLYLAVRGCGDEREQEALRSVCSAMGWLMNGLLEGNEMWGARRWIDTVSPGETEVLISGRLKIDGLVIFGDTGSSKQWWEPFYGSVQISETSDEIVSYELMFGDPALGLGKVKYNEHPRGWNWSRPEKWIFVFRR